MSMFTQTVTVLLAVMIANSLYLLLRKLEAHWKGHRRIKQGLCGAYSVEGWDRHVDWCGRQTPNHQVHVYAMDPMVVHQQDAMLRDQGL